MSKALKTVGRVIPGVGDAIASRDAAKRSQKAYQEAGRVSAAQAALGSQALRASLAPTLAALGSGEAAARSELIGAQDRQIGAIAQGAAGAGQMLQPIADTGMGAYQSQAALSGALGPEAQRLAMSSFQESPEQQYLREQGEQAIMRQASATGGVGGSRVLEALQRQGIGLAAQDFQNRFNRLGMVSQPGLSAVGSIADIGLASARDQANVIGQTGANLANLAQSIAAARASTQQAQGTGLANIAVGQAAQQANAALGAGQARAAGILGVQGGINKAVGMGTAAMTGNPFAAMGSMGGGGIGL